LFFISRKDSVMFSQDAMVRRLAVVAWVLGAALVVGCAGRPSIFPNSDPGLRKTSAEFAADAAKRSYPSTAPRGGDAQAQASVDHGLLNRIDVSNLSDATWNNVEVWVNEKYVVNIPTWPAKRMEQITFQMLYDRDGKSFPVDNKQYRVHALEVFYDGKLYNVPRRLAD
jgi:hypothetical protein